MCRPTHRLLRTKCFFCIIQVIGKQCIEAFERAVQLLDRRSHGYTCIGAQATVNRGQMNST
jgi:hypothetical protein